MKLKLVIASMSVLGLVSCPAIAATTTTTHHKHHTKPQTETIAQRDYKDMVPAGEICSISHPTMIMDSMTQSMGRSMPSPCNPGWFDRIQLSGGINVDVGKWGNRSNAFMGENYQRLSLNDAYLNMAAIVNDWVSAFVGLSYGNPTTVSDNSTYGGEYSAAYSNNIQGNGNNVIQLEQAYATIANFDMSPIFLQLGKQYQDFSRYKIHPIERSMTQVMSETLATSIKLGFIVPMGFHGSISAFDDPIAKLGATAKPTNYDVALGFDHPGDAFGFDLGAAYIYNMIGVNDTAYSVQNFTGNNGYSNRIGGVAAYADANSGPFIFSLRYTAAVQRFNPLDLPRNGVTSVVGTGLIGHPGASAIVSPSASGAKPWSAGAQAGYGFEGWGKNQNVYLGFQTSREAAGLNLPKNRWLAGYGIDMWKYTSFGLEWDHDTDYSAGTGGSGNSTNLVSLRASVQFS